MTPRERFMAAIRNQVPDRVPVAPDISNYIPCKRTGLPFWSIYFFEEVPLWRAYLDAIDHYGAEAWVGSTMGPPLLWENPRVEVKVTHEYRPDIDAMVRQTVWQTPDGPLLGEYTCMRRDPPSPTTKPMRVFADDWKRWKWVNIPPVGIDLKAAAVQREECHRRQQAFGYHMSYPGFQIWNEYVHDGLAQLSFASIDTPEILDEWCELDIARGDRELELMLQTRPDYILFGGSGTITLASPELAMKYAIPALRRWSKLCRDAGVATMLHSCGKSRVLVDMLVEHTSVECINPLEIRPMGDVELAEVKRARGRQIALMGNLHTTEVMLRGSADDVRRAAMQAMLDAGEGGGFVLSTGDQCGRDTPEENLFAIVETAKEFGAYDSNGRLPLLREALRLQPA
jgi:uroporphyrinogen decarboxylase